ncbi:uncharacterized protein LOC120341418 [Styela clava]
MTDGRYQDSIDEPLQKLWDLNITTYAIGFHPRPPMQILTSQLSKIARYNRTRLHFVGSINVKILQNDIMMVSCPEPSEVDECVNLGGKCHDYRKHVCVDGYVVEKYLKKKMCGWNKNWKCLEIYFQLKKEIFRVQTWMENAWFGELIFVLKDM